MGGGERCDQWYDQDHLRPRCHLHQRTDRDLLMVTSSNPFTDVKKSDFYYNAVLWAVKNNVTAGMSKTTFAPNAKCTRGQIVTFLYRAVK